ncbi:hypothetical protein SCLCIDRAFT_1213878 [Scleroderma citrinum Foug A]|uniref:Uncharacterized protein n=1 Tax=Scleroderma citrinum Foug A TaxID=1036808 RepID=A0A0C3AGL2_9AGAM|nr:hypothetical protein SCLCIDRAFT_1213878 [Scleroderma citrinum Foug A]
MATAVVLTITTPIWKVISSVARVDDTAQAVRSYCCNTNFDRRKSSIMLLTSPIQAVRMGPFVRMTGVTGIVRRNSSSGWQMLSNLMASW